jgi:hypothetical protein
VYVVSDESLLGIWLIIDNFPQRAGLHPLKATLLISTLAGLLAAAVAVALYTWDQMSGVDMSTDGIIALVLGVVASLALGMGLMGLVFYSNRKGHDRAAGGPASRPEDRSATSDDPEPQAKAGRR